MTTHFECYGCYAHLALAIKSRGESLEILCRYHIDQTNGYFILHWLCVCLRHFQKTALV